MRNSRKKMMGLKLGAMLGALAMAVGCGVELEGEEGNLTFEYIDSDWPSAPSSGALAVGTEVDVQVKDGRDEDEVGEVLKLIDAFSDDAQTLEVISQDNDLAQFRLQAHEEADETRIHAETDVDGEELNDSVLIRTAEADSVSAEHRCEDPIYVTNSDIQVRYMMRDAGGQRLTGFGYYPISVEPAEGGDIIDDHEELETLMVATGADAGTYELVSDISDDSSEFDLVEPADIDELDLNVGGGDSQGSVDVGEQALVGLFNLKTDGVEICQSASAAVELTTSTPDICEPTYDFDVGTGLSYINVEGLDAGECEIDISVVDTDIEESILVTVN